MPLKHDPTVDLITAKPNKQKSISAGKVKEEEKKRKLDQNDRGWWLQLWVQERGGARRHICHECLFAAQTSRQIVSGNFLGIKILYLSTELLTPTSCPGGGIRHLGLQFFHIHHILCLVLKAHSTL